MIRNILLLSSCYIDKDFNNQTPVVHYFAKEWVKMGYNVRVIHNQSVFPTIYYKIAILMDKWISGIIGFNMNFNKIPENKNYEIDNVKVSCFPIFKYIPHGRFPNKAIRNQVNKIISINVKYSFVPDIIIGHWINPQIEIINKLKNFYDAPNCLILHESGLDFKRIFKKDLDSLFMGIDIIGFRSIQMKLKFETKFCSYQKSFICNSGIPTDFFIKFHKRRIDNRLKSFIFVGTLIGRKNPSILIPSIIKNYPEKDFSISYIGIGTEEEKIKSLIAQNKLESQVKLLGKRTRAEINEVLHQVDCLIMISSNETFGLVYLEAMAAGCITICGKNEGIDGIIIHGENGFLCEAGNVDELSKLIRHINELSIKEKQQISENAIQTASKFSDYDAAATYIKSIESFL